MNACLQALESISLDQAVETACATIAPTWPLDRFIAVNPYWGHIDKPFETAAATLQRLAGSTLWMSHAYYREAWHSGRIGYQHLRQALAEYDDPVTIETLIASLHKPHTNSRQLPLLSDIVDAARDTTHEPAWRDAITHQISQFCAAYFDRDQADWHPCQDKSLYSAWRNSIGHDHSVTQLMHAAQIRQRALALPEHADDLIAHVESQLALPSARFIDLLQCALLRVNGWASWCAYQRWQARLAGSDDRQIVELLAIRLAWEFLLDDGSRDPESAWTRWQDKLAAADQTDIHQNTLAIWQRAQEVAYQQSLIDQLAKQSRIDIPKHAEVQAVFCIDVRSEVFRRALESIDDGIQTLGFAGFFGLPIEYQPLGTLATRPQLPGLLAPAMRVSDTCGTADADNALAQIRQLRLDSADSWRSFQRLPASAFTLVETLGIGYLGKILGRCLFFGRRGKAPHQHGLKSDEIQQLRPQLLIASDDAIMQKARLAARILRAMSLTNGFARLVLLTGHGSESVNNPHAAGLDCGACCGQTGEVNARALAALLNDPAVRRELAAMNIRIPDSTHFLPALHNTMTDEVTVFDRDRVPETHAADVEKLQSSLAKAGEHARSERARSLGLGQLARKPKELFRAMQSRTRDWSQTRPEWGLANNAAFIVAPRTRSRDINLQGRAFLHDYVWQHDNDGSVLELIMTAPMIVTHWINMQYYASTVDNQRYGSGNKVLHNVVGGRIGVFEGNNGDLRIGLSIQSLHDGERWMHTPLRLSVFIGAPRHMIEKVIHQHTAVRQLLDNRWLYLFRLDNGLVEAYRNGQWKACTTSYKREAA